MSGGEWDDAGVVGGEAAQEEVAFDFGLVGFVGQELRDPRRADAEAVEEVARGLGHLAVEPAGPGGGQIVVDEHRILGLAEHLLVIGRRLRPTSRRASSLNSSGIVVGRHRECLAASECTR